MNRNQNNARFACYQKANAYLSSSQFLGVFSFSSYQNYSQSIFSSVQHEKLPIIYANIRVWTIQSNRFLV
jgi:hypothetical protein